MLSVAACKATRTILRKTGRGGTAVPGEVAMKISPRILEVTSAGMEVIVVTGTNGKTTTCNMIQHALISSDRDCLLNKSGANLLKGITADLACNATWTGRPKTHFAVLECDEAALKQVVPLVHPKAVVVTNLFSDQVDRYGGVQNTLKEIRTGIEKVPDTTLVLNADEPLTASLALNVPNQVIWYGLDAGVGVRGNIDLSDSGVCPVCGGAYQYDYHIYAHLGGFGCTSCGYHRHAPDICVTTIDRVDASGSTVHMKVGKQEREVQIALPAVYNVYNAAAAIAAVCALKISPQKALESLSNVRSSFGRLETFDLDGLRLDISWINDTDYEKLCADPHLKKLFVCGECADELSRRLKRAGAGDDLQQIVRDYKELLPLLKEEGRSIFALPNYTSMMEFRKVLSQETGKKDFWE